MSNPEDEFSRFREELEIRKAAEAEMAALVEKYTDFIYESGSSTGSGYDIIVLATSKLMIERALSDKPGDPKILGVKKRLQARHFLLNHDEPWTQLISQEFPGDDLTPEDVDIIADEYSKLIETTEKSELTASETQSALIDTLNENGLYIEELVETDMVLIIHLAFVHDMPIKFQDKIETARSILFRAGKLDDPAWHALLSRFFENQ